MYLDLNDEQKMLAQTVRRFVEKECPSSRVRQIIETEHAYDEQLWAHMAEQGWMGLTVSEEYGGLHESWLTVAALFEELGRGVVPGPFLATVALAAPLLDRAGNSDQKARWLPAIVEGTCRATVAYLEEQNSYRYDAPATTATASGTAFSLNGSKMFVLDGAVADFTIVSAQLNGELGLFLVEKDAPGLQVESLESMDLTRRLARVKLENTPAVALDGAGNAAKALEYALNCAAFALSAESLGGMQWVLETSVAFAKNREQYGRLIGSYQAVAHPLADRALDLNSARSAIYNAADALDHNEAEATEAASMAKALTGDGYRQAGYTGIQTHGGIGFTWEHDIQLYFRRASGSWALFGDPRWHRERMLQAAGI
ncbi:MAG TPA: acyl-CoA dehydrogenase family protein [Chloroflexia bacterium]|nr:acyl-CoA dehydrogenase family protein [Chloroflexia bacterium]